MPYIIYNLNVLLSLIYMQWAHFPHIHFGKQQAKLDNAEGT
jgi:hypothetical protein